jgi:hypothetical protein
MALSYRALLRSPARPEEPVTIAVRFAVAI